MKRFQFRLERVLRLKEHRERLAELRQSQAARLVERTQAEVARLEQQLAQAGTAAAGGLERTETLTAWLAQSAYLAELDRELQAAQGRAKQAAQTLSEATARRAQAAREVEALRHLRQRHWLAHQEDRQREEQHLLDELGMQRWRTARRALEADGRDAAEGEPP